jgi:hypothetical protein
VCKDWMLEAPEEVTVLYVDGHVVCGRATSAGSARDGIPVHRLPGTGCGAGARPCLDEAGTENARGLHSAC